MIIRPPPKPKTPKPGKRKHLDRQAREAAHEQQDFQPVGRAVQKLGPEEQQEADAPR